MINIFFMSCCQVRNLTEAGSECRTTPDPMYLFCSSFYTGSGVVRHSDPASVRFLT
ncbi:hypothetical protein [Fibrella aquatilis]|uniref:Uncharacterized protein n=1 Tax=Fibrella aquatilis TaxID=2817059 RepID=A0A939G4T4_9BACT|nr:hypothetical protein [Fibrella aquatilis]MBO0932119.1 hypothetical protein [Fibrella aquatilis]